MTAPTVITFVAYFILLLGIGFYFYRRNESIEEYLLGGRGMGAWVTALSAQASDMSGWLLMGLPGAIYVGGLTNAWIAVGLFLGTALNWILISRRLRAYTQKTNSITLPCFFEERFGDPTGLLRVVGALVILIFFTIYASSGLVAAGKLFESTFGVSYQGAVLIGGAVIVLYTFLGGFLAVCWTDLFQGSLMVVALVVVPALAYGRAGGTAGIRQALMARDIARSVSGAGGATALLAIVSAMAWGLGYFGQPHILVRFMSAKSLAKLSRSMVIAIIWVFISLAGAVAIGWIGIGLFRTMPGGDPEKVFIYMIAEVTGPWIGGVMLAAILSAIMSTIDSQLLVSSSALTEDFYQKVIKRDAGPREVVLVGRICVIIISVIALVLALGVKTETILEIVAYAWGGFGAAFGPLVLFALYSRRTSWQAALAGMIAGTVVLVLWKQVGLSEHLYEIVPGFAANCVAVLVTNQFVRQNDPMVLQQYDAVRAEVQGEDAMNRIAVDVVLLPDAAVTTLTLSASADLVKRCGSEIALDRETCLPHISLAMGCIEPDAVEAVRGLLGTIGREHPLGELGLTGVVTSLNARGQSVSAFALAKTEAIQKLHERVMDALQPYAKQDVTEAALCGDEPIAETTLAWIRNFREKAAFGAYFPHITIGYGTVEQVMSFPIRFAAPRLAVCHLGNHCTCRKVLGSIPL